MGERHIRLWQLMWKEGNSEFKAIEKLFFKNNYVNAHLTHIKIKKAEKCLADAILQLHVIKKSSALRKGLETVCCRTVISKNKNIGLSFFLFFFL